jgi:hypothetical protein
MPTLFRFLIVVGLLAGLVYGGMFALAEFVEPTQKDVSYKLPRDKLPR